MDQSGEVLLTAGASGSSVVTVNATTGRVLATLNGSDPHLTVVHGVFGPSGAVIVVNGSYPEEEYTLLCIDASNRLVWRSLIAQPKVDVGEITLDARNGFVYLQWESFNSTGQLYVISQYEVTSGKLVRNAVVPTDGNGMFDAIAADCAPATVWFTQLASRRLARLQLSSGELKYVQVGDIPLLYEPSTVAVLPDRAGVLVAQVGLGVGWDGYFQVFHLDVRGKKLGELPPAQGTCASSGGVPLQFVAVDAATQRVCATQCDDSILVYSLNLTTQFTVAIPHDQPRACYPAGNDTLLATGRASNQVTRLDLHTGEVVSVLQGADESVFCGLSVDPRDRSVWVADLTGSVVHFHENGTLLSTWAFSNDTASHQMYYLTVDAVHSRVIVSEEMTVRGVIPPTGHLLWLDIHTGAVMANYTASLPAGGVAISEDGRTVYAAQLMEDAVLLFSQDSGVVTARGVME